MWKQIRCLLQRQILSITGKDLLEERKQPYFAYLMSRYPAVSHTFFLQEIRGLRTRGIRIETASINPPDRPNDQLSDKERAEHAKTCYLKTQPLHRAILQLARICLTRPAVVWRGFCLALKLQPGHILHTAYSLFYLAEALLLGDWMRRNGMTHLHIHFSGPVATVGMIAGLAWRLPYSLTVHGPDEFFDQNETALRQKIDNAAFVICISDFCRSQLMRIVPSTTWHKLRVIRLGIQPSLADLPIDERPRDKTRILCTGRLVGAKGQAILLLATDLILKRGHHVEVTLIGDGEDRASLERLASDHGLQRNVIFAGAQSHAEVIKQLQMTDLFVLPSFAEGVPVALMEAMAIGVPCISTFIAGIPELIRHEVDGLLVPAGSVDALVGALERLILNVDERERFRASARAQVLTHYNLAQNLDTLAATLTELAPYAVRHQNAI